MQRVSILGVPIDPVTTEGAFAQILALLTGGKHHVMTPNSEMLVYAKHHPSFREILLQTSLNLPDSAGLLWAARVTG